MPVPLGVVKPEQQSTITGKGMPVRKEGQVQGNGGPIVKWEIMFPDHRLLLKPSEREVVQRVLS